MKALGLAGLVLVLVGGCTKDSMLASRAKGADGLIGIKVRSTSFKNGEMIPKQYTADGQDISPPLTWGNGPDQSKGTVIIVEDPDAPGKEPFVHWIVYGLVPSMTGLPEGASSAMSKGSSTLTEGKNSKGLNGYVGPEPMPGKAHRYVFEVFTVDTAIKLPAGATKAEVVAAMKGHVLMQGELNGVYKR